MPIPEDGFISSRKTGRPFGVPDVRNAKTDLFNGLHSVFYCHLWQPGLGILDSNHDGDSSQNFSVMKLENMEMNY